LNSAEPVYRFEALKGRLLFTRDHDFYIKFFSIASREYESLFASFKFLWDGSENLLKKLI
jgi:hypothetical protein